MEATRILLPTAAMATAITLFSPTGCKEAPVEPQSENTAQITSAVEAFVNWESPQVHPIDVTSDGARVVAVNTADARLQVFDASGGVLTLAGSIPVGIDPVTVRLRTDTEAWVVNHISDSITVVDLSTLTVRTTFLTADEPTDVVFAGTPERAYVSCSQANAIQVFDDPGTLEGPFVAPTATVDLVAEDPRQFAVSNDGQTVYVSIFESGNGTTILGGGTNLGLPPPVVNNPAGPYNGTNPPPNTTDVLNPFDPPQNPLNSPAPPVGLIVREDNNGDWRDDNGGIWTDVVSGPNANLSGRPVGWTLVDRDVAIIDTTTNGVTYAGRMLTTPMAIAVNPVSDLVTVVGTEASNEIRFEPVLRSQFVRATGGAFAPVNPNATSTLDLNQHLTYSDAEIAAQADPFTADQALRDASIGDPRAIVWIDDGSRAYIAGLGSNNVAIIASNGARLSPTGTTDPAIEVGVGPTGLALDETTGFLYVLNRFDATISTIELSTESVTSNVTFFDPTPTVIRDGRPMLYDTHARSGLGQVACASCHVDGRTDRLAWDLGNPAGDEVDLVPYDLDLNTGDYNLRFGREAEARAFHPMKGPMLTQTFQDIIGKEPLHWRGDRPRLHDFADAFTNLQGDDEEPNDTDMDSMRDFLATIHMPPNPYRTLENGLAASITLPEQLTNGLVDLGGLPIVTGNAQNGLVLYQREDVVGTGDQSRCIGCHSLPTGGSSNQLDDFAGMFFDAPLGSDDQARLWVSGSTMAPPFTQTLKVPQLRTLYERIGFDYRSLVNTQGFGMVHDGTVGSITELVELDLITFNNQEEVADVVAFLLSLAGPGFEIGDTDTALGMAPGPDSLDTHAGVGAQVTLSQTNILDPVNVDRRNRLLAIADASPSVTVIVKGGGRGSVYLGLNQFQLDRASEIRNLGRLDTVVQNGTNLTYTVVPIETAERMAIDRDRDGCFDQDEIDGGTNPTVPDCTP